MDNTLSGTLLCIKLRFCNNAMENKYYMGNYNDVSVRYPDYYEYTKPPQDKVLSLLYYS